MNSLVLNRKNLSLAVASTIFSFFVIMQANADEVSCSNQFSKIGDLEVLTQGILLLNGKLFDAENTDTDDVRIDQISMRFSKLCKEQRSEFRFANVGYSKGQIIIYDRNFGRQNGIKDYFDPAKTEKGLLEHDLQEYRVLKVTYYLGSGPNQPIMFGQDVAFLCSLHRDRWVGGLPPGKRCQINHAFGKYRIGFSFYDHYWPKESWAELAKELERATMMLTNDTILYQCPECKSSVSKKPNE